MSEVKMDYSELGPKDLRKFGGETEVHPSAMKQVEQLAKMLDDEK